MLVNRNNYYLQFLCTYNVHLKRYCSIFLCFTVAFYFLSFASCCFAFIFSDGVSVLVVCLTHNVPRNSKHLLKVKKGVIGWEEKLVVERKKKIKIFSFYVVANDASIQVEFLLLSFFFFFNIKRLKDLCKGLKI